MDSVAQEEKMTSGELKRVIKRASYNWKELNELWVPAKEKELNNLGDSEVIKVMNREFLEYRELKRLAAAAGIEPFPYFRALAKKGGV